MNILSFFNATRAFNCLSSGAQAHLAKYGVIQDLRRAQGVWHRGDKAEECVYILTGVVEIRGDQNSQGRGSSTLVGFFGPQEFCGLIPVMKGDAYPVSAVVGSRASRILRLRFRAAIQEAIGPLREELILWQHDCVARQMGLMRERVEILSADRLHSRLVRFFDHMIERFSPPTGRKGENVRIDLPLTKSLIARAVEARVETVIRTLRGWEREGYVKMTPDSVFLYRRSEWRSPPP